MVADIFWSNLFIRLNSNIHLMNQTTTHKIWPQLQKLNLKYDVILEG